MNWHPDGMQVLQAGALLSMPQCWLLVMMLYSPVSSFQFPFTQEQVNLPLSTWVEVQPSSCSHFSISWPSTLLPQCLYTHNFLGGNNFTLQNCINYLLSHLFWVSAQMYSHQRNTYLHKSSCSLQDQYLKTL